MVSVDKQIVDKVVPNWHDLGIDSNAVRHIDRYMTDIVTERLEFAHLIHLEVTISEITKKRGR